jgi:hypothetical protein
MLVERPTDCSMNKPILLPSDRSFGLTFTVFFALLAAFLWWRGASWAPWPAALSLLTLIVALTRPALLRPLNHQWMRLAALLHRFVSPLVLGLIYFGLFTPMAMAMRARGRDALSRTIDQDCKTYWLDRMPPGPDPKSLPDQF